MLQDETSRSSRAAPRGAAANPEVLQVRGGRRSYVLDDTQARLRDMQTIRAQAEDVAVIFGAPAGCP